MHKKKKKKIDNTQGKKCAQICMAEALSVWWHINNNMLYVYGIIDAKRFDAPRVPVHHWDMLRL